MENWSWVSHYDVHCTILLGVLLIAKPVISIMEVSFVSRVWTVCCDSRMSHESNPSTPPLTGTSSYRHSDRQTVRQIRTHQQTHRETGRRSDIDRKWKHHRASFSNSSNDKTPQQKHRIELFYYRLFIVSPLSETPSLDLPVVIIIQRTKFTQRWRASSWLVFP